jgi:KaiC/GvpD/RAD55 family RecA-like ATPase
MPAMSKTAEKKTAYNPPDDERAERLRMEAMALRHLFNLPENERAEAAEALRPWELVLLAKDLAAAFRAAPGMQLSDLGALLKRPALESCAAELDAAQAAPLLDPAHGQDPEDLAEAYAAVLATTDKAADLQRIREAAALLERAKAAQKPQDRRADLAAAVQSLEAAERADAVPLAEAWNAYRKTRFEKNEAGPKDAVMLDKARGAWADWFNRNLGPRGGLEPGRLLLVGGGPGGGKTTLGATIAVDAMAAGCPVLFWQLELSREETLENMLCQVGPKYAKTAWRSKANHDLPEAWADLLTLPKCDTPEAAHVENIIRSMESQARKVRQTGAHAVRGLVVVDYAQLLTVEDRTARDARFEVLEKAASRLAKAAGECGAVLVLLSQVNKAARNDGNALAGTSYAGADLERMAHAAVTIWKSIGGKPAAAFEPGDTDPENGVARLLSFTKTRGQMFYESEHGQMPQPPGESKVAWYTPRGRALHDGGTPKQAAIGWEE